MWSRKSVLEFVKAKVKSQKGDVLMKIGVMAIFDSRNTGKITQ
jgi:hypothetical protein